MPGDLVLWVAMNYAEKIMDQGIEDVLKTLKRIGVMDTITFGDLTVESVDDPEHGLMQVANTGELDDDMRDLFVTSMQRSQERLR